jgi:hypothetical protein
VARWPRAFLVACTLWVLALVPGASVAAVPLAAPITTALRARDVYASPSVLGAAAPKVEAQLAAHAADLTGRGQPVKLALVPSLGRENAFAYAERLRREIGWEGTLVIATLSGATGAAGPRSRDSMANAFTAEHIDRIANPTRRLVAAADIAVPPPPRGDSGIRGLFVMLGLTLFGGAWAIGWGVRREQRRARAGFGESREALRVSLDALQARTTAMAQRPGLSTEVRSLLDAARDGYGAADAGIARAVSQRDLDACLVDLRRGLAQLEGAGILIGEPQPMSDPFAGLCSADPTHGPAVVAARLRDRDLLVPVCHACREAADAGHPAARRLISIGGKPVPFDEGGLRFPAIPED